MAHGSDEQKQAHLSKILSAEEIWCQGFSEPDAGSDLAAVRTRAERRGDAYVLNGQKVWSSFAHIADFCILVTQSDPDGQRYRNLTYLIVDMHAPGVEVRPLRQITGEAEFNEIFFNDVEVPVSNRLGEEGEGWQVAMTTLLHERGDARLRAHRRARGRRRAACSTSRASASTATPAGASASRPSGSSCRRSASRTTARSARTSAPASPAPRARRSSCAGRSRTSA